MPVHAALALAQGRHLCDDEEIGPRVRRNDLDQLKLGRREGPQRTKDRARPVDEEARAARLGVSGGRAAPRPERIVIEPDAERGFGRSFEAKEVGGPEEMRFRPGAPARSNEAEVLTGIRRFIGALPK
jgi:hypothetical protein